MIGIRILLGYHIQMSLKDDSCSVFVSRTCGLLYNYITGRIHNGFQSQFFTESPGILSRFPFLF